MGLLARIFGSKAKHTEGAYYPGPYQLSDGWLPAGSSWNFWQMGQNVQANSTCSAMVEACVSAYSQTVAMCPGDHWRRLSNGGRERVTNSALTRIIRKPNDYQTISDFLLNGTRELYQTGEWFALAIRNNRFEISEMHMMRSRQCRAHVAETGEIFYSLGGNPIVERRFDMNLMVPARDVLHVRLHTPRDPLKGESPLVNAACDIAASNMAVRRHLAFLSNEAKASIVLSAEPFFTREQTATARELWDAQTKGDNAGGTPILSGGLKPIVISSNSRDSQLAEIMKLTDQNIALVFRVPLQILGIGGTPFASTELLMQSWVASGLGFALNHIEEAFGQLFGLGGFPDEYVEFNTRSLLRSSFRERIEGLAASVIGGIHSSDEARNEEDLPVTPGGAGAEPRVQQQVVPLSYGMAMKPPEVAPPAALALPPPDDDPEEVDEDAERYAPEAVESRIDALVLSRLH